MNALNKRVDASYCAGKTKPDRQGRCRVPCAEDCVVSEWSDWGACSVSCGPNGGRWTKCFLDRGYDDCGPGTRHRAVYCMNALNKRVDASYCAGKTKPDRQGTCRVPCAEDCVVSEWSDWGACSVSCGPNGGARKRSRRIVAYPYNRDLNPCLSEDELTQSKPCNIHVSCHTYSWQATAWGECQMNSTANCEEGVTGVGGCLMNETASCGERIGMETRDVGCEMETGSAADASQCDGWSLPEGSRPCDVACPQDCELSPWSTWSSCSASCGLHARRTRTKRVLTVPVNGGRPCAQETDENGLITQYKSMV
eukprot:XP_011668790.1 PREDICTED: thrombospondin type-1 domain-containing protein 7A-like [Strongylocentrotus purpuratus]